VKRARYAFRRKQPDRTVIPLHPALSLARSLAAQGATADAVGQQVGFALVPAPHALRADTLRRCARLARRGALLFNVDSALLALETVDTYRAEALAG